MDCSLKDCSNKINDTPINCYRCDKETLCSNKCLIEHVFQAHQNSNIDSGKKSNFSIKRVSTCNSPFIQQGEFLRELVPNSYFDYQNFEYVIDSRTKKKKLIGSGSFGDVYLNKNKIDNKVFAVKYVINKIIKT